MLSVLKCYSCFTVAHLSRNTTHPVWSAKKKIELIMDSLWSWNVSVFWVWFGCCSWFSLRFDLCFSMDWVHCNRFNYFVTQTSWAQFIFLKMKQSILNKHFDLLGGTESVVKCVCLHVIGSPACLWIYCTCWRFFTVQTKAFEDKETKQNNLLKK